MIWGTSEHPHPVCAKSVLAAKERMERIKVALRLLDETERKKEALAK